MSNRIHFEPTKFESVRTGLVSHGCRIYDEDSCMTYTNSWDSIPDDDIDIIRRCIEDFKGGSFNDLNDFDNMIDCVETEQNGVYVGEQWYDWNEIKQLFEEVEKG